MGRRFTGSQSLYCLVLSTIVCPSSPCKLLGQVRPSGQRHCLSTHGDPYKSTLLQTSLRSKHSGNSSSLSWKIKINKHASRATLLFTLALLCLFDVHATLCSRLVRPIFYFFSSPSPLSLHESSLPVGTSSFWNLFTLSSLTLDR